MRLNATHIRLWNYVKNRKIGPSNPEIARHLGVSQQHVHKLICDLREAGKLVDTHDIRRFKVKL